MNEFFQQLIAVDWGGLIGAAVASGVGLSFITQILKAKWIAVPAKKYPRAVSAVLAVLVGIVSTISVGLELSSLASFIVFSIVSFVTSGIAYDVVRRLVAEIKQEEPVTNLGDVTAETLQVDHIKPNTKLVKANENSGAVKGPEKSVDEVAQEVIDGLWSSGETRKTMLEQAGYNFDKVQSKVKELLAKQ